MAELLSWYSAQLVSCPVLTKSLTSAVLLGSGDAIQQYIEYKSVQNSAPPHSLTAPSNNTSSTSPSTNKAAFGVLTSPSGSDVFPSLSQSQAAYPFVSSLILRLRYRLLPGFLIYFQLQRCLRMILYGLVVLGPAVHYWFLFLSQFFNGAGILHVLGKVLADQLLFAPIMNTIFFPFIGLLEGKRCAEIYRRWTIGFPQVMLLNYRIFPIAQLINFGLIPFEYQVLFINIIALIFNIFVSRILNRPPSTPPVPRKNSGSELRKVILAENDANQSEEIEKEELLREKGNGDSQVEMQTMKQDV